MIYKAPSIYNLGGGGGGGLTPGGELPESEFINVDNLTNSSYTNNSQDTINFVFETDTKTEINAIIQLTNNNNAVVNCYWLNPSTNIYEPLNYSGSNTVSSGSNYEISVDGNVYNIDEVNQGGDPDMLIIGGDYGILKLKKMGSLYWLTHNFTGNINAASISRNGTKYYKQIQVYGATFKYGLRLPSKSEVTNLVDYCKANGYNDNPAVGLKNTVNWDNDKPSAKGDNHFGLNFQGDGYVYSDGETDPYLGISTYWPLNEDAGDDSFYMQDNAKGVYFGQLGSYNGFYVPLKLVKSI